MNNPMGVSTSIKGNQGTTRGYKIFSLPRVVPWFPLLGLTPSGLFMGSISTLIYTSELILCFTDWNLVRLGSIYYAGYLPTGADDVDYWKLRQMEPLAER